MAELPFEVKRLTLGEVQLRGQTARSSSLSSTPTRWATTSRVLRLTQHGYHVGNFNTAEALGKHVDLATLVEDRPDE